MKTRSRLSPAPTAALLTALMAVSAPPARGQGTIISTLDPKTGNVTWGGDASDQSPIQETLPAAGSKQGMLTFAWTQNGKPHVKYESYGPDVNATNRALKRTFYRPNDPTITDWTQTITDGSGTSTVSGGNIQRHSPWAFFPLSDLPQVAWRIPDLAPSQGGLTIFAAVNLDLYLHDNPNGFLGGDWQPGQSLDSLGVSVLGGHVAGLQGITWATTDFTFDPNSADGFVPTGGDAALLDSAAFEQQNGAIRILGEHAAAVPEPSAGALLALGALPVAVRARRARRRNRRPAERPCGTA